MRCETTTGSPLRTRPIRWALLMENCRMESSITLRDDHGIPAPDQAHQVGLVNGELQDGVVHHAPPGAHGRVRQDRHRAAVDEALPGLRVPG